MARLILLVLLGCMSLGLQRASAQPQRYEAEAIGTPTRNANDLTGYDSINLVVGRAADAGASNGEILFTSGNNRNFKFLFHGSGVDLITRTYDEGTTFVAILDDGQATQTLSTFAATWTDQARIPLFSGLPVTLHTVELRRVGPAGSLHVDAFEVHDDSPRIRIDDSETERFSYSPSGNWTSGDPGGDIPQEAYLGTTTYGITEGDSVTVSFSGRAVALITMARVDARDISWSIDGGARTGSIDISRACALNFGQWHRWSFVLANDLVDGPHTLTITCDPPTTASNFVFFFDAIEYVTDLVPAASRNWELFQ